MDAEKLRELEDAIQFGQDFASLTHLLDFNESIFGSTRWSEEFKRETASHVDGVLALVQKFVAVTDEKYAAVPRAQKAREYLLDRLGKFEQTVDSYLDKK